MRNLLLIIGALSLTSCATFSNHEEYVLKLATQCEEIEITPQKTKLKCPNHVDKKRVKGYMK